MMAQQWQQYFVPFGVGGFGGLLFLALIIWTLYWKGMALWRAAQRGQRNWFIALLIINTAGILEILYLYVFSKKRDQTSGA